jgi:hypothetical protein
MPPSLDGTFIEKMHEAVLFSEHNRAQVERITRRVRDEVMHDLIGRNKARDVPPPSTFEISTVTDERCTQRSSYKNAVGDEQWGARLATMYALVELVAAQRQANSIAEQQLTAQLTTNRLLTALLESFNAVNHPVVPRPRSGT